MGYLSRSYDSKTGGDLSLIILRGSNDSMTRGGSISMRHPLTAMAANDIHEGGIVQSGPLSLQHTAIHNNYHIPNHR